MSLDEREVWFVKSDVVVWFVYCDVWQNRSHVCMPLFFKKEPIPKRSEIFDYVYMQF